MTAPSLRVLFAVIVAVGLLGGVAIVTADAGDDDPTLIDRVHDGVADHVPGDHHGDHGAHHDGDHSNHHDGDHAAHHDGDHSTHHDGDHAAHHDEHHSDGGHCD